MTQPGTEPVLRRLIALALPIVLANTVHVSQQLINTFWVGRLGANAVAAVSVSFPVIFLLISLGGGLSIAGSILVAQYAGAGDRAMVNRVGGQTVAMTVAIALLLTITGIAATPALLALMRVDAAVFADAAHYLRISFAGILWLFLFAMYQSLLRAIGDTRRPLRIVACGVLLNIVLDPVLIFGWGPAPALGVAGAAWATLITQSVCALAGLRQLLDSRYGLQIIRRDLRPDRALIGRLARLGLPASLEQTMSALSISTITVLVAGFGTLALAAYGIGFRVLTFVIMPAFSISMAASTLVGHSIGAGDQERAAHITRVAVLLSFTILGFLGMIFLFASAPIVQLFVPNDPALVAAGGEVLRCMALSFAFTGIHLSLSGTFRGAGDTLATMVLAAVGTWLVLLPAAWGLSWFFGERGIWLAYPVASVVNAAIALAYYRRGRWRRIQLTSERRLESRVGAEIMIEEGQS